ncbi:hypothetical protein GCM10027051_21290 [Niabella terrae]
MALTEENIRELFHSYVAGSITAEEKSLLFASLQEPGHQPLLRELLRSTWEETGADQRLPDQQSAAILRKILQDADRRIGNRKIQWWWSRKMIAAVLITGFIGALSWFLLMNRAPEKNKVSHSVTDIQPGTEGAVLTLSDGRKIALDSTGNTVIADADITAVLKDGRLQYEGESAQRQPVYNTVTTSKGKHFELQLPDGSRVWLNSASAITYPLVFDDAAREVSIKGEVYFEVSKKSSGALFIVNSKQQRVTVLGTRFNINSFEDVPGIKTTLIEGKVKVRSGNSEEKILAPGQQSVVSGNQPIQVRAVDTEGVMAWKSGNFNFTGLRFEEVMQQLARWYNIEVRYEGQVPALEFEGKLNRNVNLSSILKFFKGSGIQYRMENHVLIIINH